MASIIRDRNKKTKEYNGCRSLQFITPTGKRDSIRLGKIPAKGAETIRAMVDAIISDRLCLKSHDPEVSAWIGRLQQQNPSLYDKLAAKGVLQYREKPESTTLGAFLDAFIKTQGVKVKASTKTVYGHTKRCLIEYFKKDKPLADISPGDADEWRAWLTSSQNLAPNTVRRRCGIARQFFKAAIRKRLLTENPFAELQEGVAVKGNKSRDYFVTREEANKVLKACPDDEWRLLFSLARYGALRCPSEILALTWADIDWDNERITVTSSKTAHHEGKESRVIPLFPEIREYLDKAFFDPANENKQYVIANHRNANHRTRLEKIIKRAGLKPWPKLFQNLRASRATELASEFPAHVAAEWTGHSEKIAQEHYWRVTDADFEKATRKCKQKCKQKPAVEGGNEREGETANPAFPADYLPVPASTFALVGDEGLEPPTSTV
ncbi:tyrosine-type recombinase/integrase [Bythopirellula goksoeyrii]|uniref:Site-specific tyrosine recombinase XerC n=1 Tax=Bythopirellula goksoeyrii TaxID=1400387 RepID=A0A5B9QLU5_9BACT|nr:site-specific integrase [Bythopirellula goksoeyrii]QEG35121.1 site-specific tyrosine recombinase XerC [Bythopirellula goksoeyrii]